MFSAFNKPIELAISSSNNSLNDAGSSSNFRKNELILFFVKNIVEKICKPLESAILMISSAFIPFLFI